MSGTVTRSIPDNGTVASPAGNGYKYLTGRTLTNAGTATYSDLTYFLQLQNGAVFNNQATGTFDVQTDQPINGTGTPAPTFNNAGTVKKSAGTGTATLTVPFNNSGVDALTGALTDRKSTRLNSSHQIISYAVFRLFK